jgi:uncharacterized membrane protein (UPF0127 family)
MKHWPFLLAVIAMAGCNPPAEAPKESTNPEPVAKAPERPLETAPPSVADPSRVYQLADLEVKDVGAPKGTVKAWIMDSQGKRTEGMMFLRPDEVKDSQGMLFVFKEDQDLANSFWMKDTPIALDIAFVTADGKVINVGKGKPNSPDKVQPDAAYRYVLELKQGMAESMGVKPGARLKLPEGLVPID